jgi:deoxycytidylate deaminase
MMYVHPVLGYKLASTPYEPNRTIRNYLHLAYSIAYKSDVRKGKHCAIVVDNRDDIHSVGINQLLTVGWSTHAEVKALDDLRIAGGSTVGKTLIVIKIRKLGGFGNSRPCLACLNIIKARGISKLIWSGNNGEFHYAYL